MLNRHQLQALHEKVNPGKVLVLYGPRQVGKTTLISQYLSGFSGSLYQGTGDNAQLRELFASGDFSKILPFFQGYNLIVIDEAQLLPDVGRGLKILVDNIPDVSIIATGSSAFDLSNKVGEPLVGRQTVLRLFPISVSELKDNFGPAYVHEHKENLLIFGSYPEVISLASFQEKKEYLYTLRDSYLFKDILALEDIRNSNKILDLLKLLAFQVGSEVSHAELGNALSMSKNTVERYLDLLEKSFVIFNIRGFSRNLRSEVSKTSRYYFFDVGVRNAVIGNFNMLSSRDDVGRLWENFLYVERSKKQHYFKIFSQNYFWRTWEQKEIDMVEDRDGALHGFEFKYSDILVPAPKQWTEAYPQASFQVINSTNFMDFIG